jgi:hypothetical protein
MIPPDTTEIKHSQKQLQKKDESHYGSGLIDCGEMGLVRFRRQRLWPGNNRYALRPACREKGCAEGQENAKQFA